MTSLLKRMGVAGFVTLLAMCFFGTNDASAQDISRHVIGSGATSRATGSGMILNGTVGQAAVGVSGGESGTFDLYHGFWYPINKTTEVPNEPVTGVRTLWNTPNPFSTSTTIKYELTERSHVRVRVYDMSGRLVTTLVDDIASGGTQQVVWNGKDESGEAVSTGYYFYTLDAQPMESGKQMVSYRQKMLLMK